MPKKQKIFEFFSQIPDPRRANHNTKKYELIEIIVIAVIGSMCGAETWVDIADFGTAKLSWLKQSLELKNRIPSPDTFGRVFSILNPVAFEQCFLNWTATLVKIKKDSVIAIDGKTLRASKNGTNRPLHIVNAFAVEHGIVIGQRKVDGKSNEITAIPELLDLLFVEGCIITADAMATQAAIVHKVLENKADYVFAVKGNQRRMMTDISKAFGNNQSDIPGFNYTKVMSSGHGRQEKRECFVSTGINQIRDLKRWHGLKSIIKIVCERTIDTQTTKEVWYYISGLEYTAEKFLEIIKSHWKIENSLHWVLDVVFKEDASRVRIGHAGENMAYLRKMALNILRKDKNSSISLRRKMNLANWNNSYLEELLGMA